MEQPLTIEHAARLLRAGDLDDAESIARQLLKRDKRNVDAIQLPEPGVMVQLVSGWALLFGLHRFRRRK